MNEGKLRFITTAKGRIIVTTQEEIDSILEFEGQNHILESNSPLPSNYNFPPESRSQYNPNPGIPGNSNHSNDLSIKLFIDELREMRLELLEYAEQAGQVRLLTDNNKFYQDEYFKFKYENERLTDLNKQLENVNKQQRLKIDQYQELISNLETEISKKSFIIEELETKINELASELDKKNKKWWKFSNKK